MLKKEEKSRYKRTGQTMAMAVIIRVRRRKRGLSPLTSLHTRTVVVAYLLAEKNIREGLMVKR